MEILFDPAQELRIVRDVRMENGRLIFQHHGADRFLIVTAPVESKMNLNDPFFQKGIAVAANTLENGACFSLGDGDYQARIVTKAEYTRNGCSVSNATAALGVFACYSHDQGSLTVYVPSERSKYHIYRNVQKVFCVVEPETVKAGAFRRKEEFSGFFRNTLRCEGTYESGLYYEVEGVSFLYPVTPEMVQRPFYTSKRPKYAAVSNSMKVEQS